MMPKKYKTYRKQSGMAQFERNCRLTRSPNGRLVKAWRVPGTQEAGRHSMFIVMYIRSVSMH